MNTLNNITIQDIYNVVSLNADKCNNRFRVTRTDGSSSIMRLFISTSDRVCEFAKGKRRSGYYLEYIYPAGTFAKVEPMAPTATAPAKMAKRNARKVADLLAASGLWPEYRAQCEALASLSEEEITELFTIYARWWDYSKGHEYRDTAYNDFKLFFQSRNLPVFDIYHFQQMGTKGQIISVPYDKYCRQYHRDKVNNGIEAMKQGLSDRPLGTYGISWRGSYDYSVSLQRDSEGVCRGWFSAEYKGCGNGHYYLLLDASHALYLEDD